MKKSTLALLLSCGLLIAHTSCKKEGCTDSKATNYNAEAKKNDGSCTYAPEVPAEPEINIVSPSGSHELTRDITVEVTFTDDIDLETATFTLSADAFSGGSYYSTTRAISGTEETVVLDVTLPEVEMSGDHYLLVTCMDSDGNESTEGMDFTLTDSQAPVLTDSSCTKEAELGVDDVDVSLTFSDPGGVKSVDLEFWATKYLGMGPMGEDRYTDEPVKMDETQKDYPIGVYEETTYTHSFSTGGNVFYGDYEVRYTITDLKGNVITGVFYGECVP